MHKSLKAILVSLAAATALMLGPAATPVQAQEIEVSVSLFHRELAPHGRWFEHPRWGWVWFPTAIEPSWRPYSRGHWVWTEEYGWYWESEEPFGWAVYHYGRWAYDEYYGWIWVPGVTWGPAWVAFRYSDSYIGWAPLPPDTLAANYGFDPAYTEMSAVYYQPRWVFIPRHYFLAPGIYAYAVPPARNYIFIRQTVNVTNYVTVNRVVVNRSIEPRRIEAAIGRRIEPAHINLVGDPRRVSGRSRRGDEINVFRPTVNIPRGAAIPPPPPTAQARPEDKPRVAVRRDAIAPSERRRIDRNGPAETPGPKVITPGPKVTTPQPDTTPKPSEKYVAPKPTEKYVAPKSPGVVVLKPSEKYVAPKASPDLAPKQPPAAAPKPPPPKTLVQPPPSKTPPCGGAGQPPCPPR